MTGFISKAAMAFAGVWMAALPVQAQTAGVGESYAHYGDARGWGVYAIQKAGGFAGCRAVRSGAQGQMMLEKSRLGWRLIVPTYQTARFGGAILGVDKHDIDSQFGFEGGFASRDLGGADLNLIRNGSFLSVEIMGDPRREWPLTGSAAAILKAEECASSYGVAARPQAQQAPASPQPQPPVQAQPQTAYATCESITTGQYPCVVTRHTPEQGYREAYQIDPNGGGAPRYFVKIRSEFEADVWGMFDGNGWRYLGAWEPVGPNGACSQPKGTQGAEALSNLGQDAWNLCVR